MSVKAGGYHTCALTGDGRVKCWGANWSGQLGTGTTEGTSVPVNVSGLSSGVVAVEVGQSHNCAILQSGEVRCWGESYYGQTGDGATGSDRLTPVTVTVLQAAPLALALGGFHTCALVAPDNLLCWGANWEGQLGNGTTDDSAAPVQVTGLPADLTGVTAGTRYTCAYSQSGGVYCWGANYSGQAGDGTTENRSTATAVEGLASGVAALDAGDEHVRLPQRQRRRAGLLGQRRRRAPASAQPHGATPPCAPSKPSRPSLRLNYTDGKPGSVFSLTATATPMRNPDAPRQQHAAHGDRRHDGRRGVHGVSGHGGCGPWVLYRRGRQCRRSADRRGCGLAPALPGRLGAAAPAGRRRRARRDNPRRHRRRAGAYAFAGPAKVRENQIPGVCKLGLCARILPVFSAYAAKIRIDCVARARRSMPLPHDAANSNRYSLLMTFASCHTDGVVFP